MTNIHGVFLLCFHEIRENNWAKIHVSKNRRTIFNAFQFQLSATMATLE